MAERIQRFDWASTDLGEKVSWPASLRTVVDLILESPLPQIVLWGPRLVQIYNDSYAAVMGAKHPSGFAQPTSACWPEVWSFNRPHYEAVFEGRPVSIEGQYLPLERNGVAEPSWFDLTYSPIRDDAGIVAGVLVTTIEITGRRQAEAAAQDSELQLRGVLDAMVEGFASFDPDFTICDVNQETLRLDGRTRDELVGRSHWEAFPGTEHSPLGLLYRWVAAERRPGAIEHLYEWPDGRTMWIDARAYPTPDGGVAAFWRDITDRKAADAALRASDERYRALFESMDEAYAVVEVLKDDAGRWADFRFIEVNSAFMVHTNMPYPVGQTATELLGTSNPRWTELYGQALDTGETLRVEESEATLGITFDLNIFSLDRAHNRVAVLFTNITDRKKAEAALRESEERQRLMVELVPVLLWSASPDGQEVSINERWLAYTGQDKAQAQHYGWLDAIHPDDLPQARAAFEHAFATGEPLERQQRIHKVGNGYRWHLVRHVPVRDDAGTITRWFGAAVDIHDSKLAEQALEATERRLQTLVEGVPQLVWRAVHEGHWTWASPQWTDYTGQAEPDSHGHGWLDPVHPEDRDLVLAVWEGAIGRGEFHADYRLCHKAEDRYRWFQTRATPVHDDRGEIVEWLGTSTDVDDLRRLQERQQVLVAELQHRVRNILAVIRSIVRRTLDGEQSLHDYAQHLEGRLAALARTQVLLTREVGRDVDLEDLIRDELVAQAVDEERITMCGPDVAVSPKAAEVLTLAIHELATNALKYGATGQAGGRLRIEWSIETRDGARWLDLRWTESGVAIAVLAPRRIGFGTELITRRVPYELKGTGEIEIRPGGLACHLSFPLSDRGSILETSSVVADPGGAR